MKASFLCLTLGVLAFTGCSDRSSPSAQSTNSTTSGSPTAPVDGYLGAITKGEQSAIKTIDVTSISKAIQLFQVEKGRYPKDLNELVQEKYLPRIPETPYGNKLDYDPATGVVKVVKQ